MCVCIYVSVCICMCMCECVCVCVCVSHLLFNVILRTRSFRCILKTKKKQQKKKKKKKKKQSIYGMNSLSNIRFYCLLIDTYPVIIFYLPPHLLYIQNHFKCSR